MEKDRAYRQGTRWTPESEEALGQRVQAGESVTKASAEPTLRRYGIDLSKKTIRDIVETRMRADPEYARQVRASGHWTTERVKAMSAGQIIDRLRSIGVPFDAKEFEADLTRLGSAERVSDHWWRRHPVKADGLDQDFPFLAALELHARLLPQIVTSETLDDWMQEGYKLLKGDRVADACDVWLKVWDHIRDRVGEGDHAVEDADALVRGHQSVFNWCQDLDGELESAGWDDAKYYEARLRYAQEFLRIFTRQEDLLPHFHRTEAETLFRLDRVEEGDACFRRLVARYPDSVWGYVGWGDQYGMPCFGSKNRERAERIYKDGLARPGIEQADVLRDRLVALQRDWGRPAEAAPSAAKPRQQTAQIPATHPDRATKTGRNDPCPCGSGRKYKKCCGS